MTGGEYDPYEKIFKPFRDERDSREKTTADFLNAMSRDSEYLRYEENRTLGKQGLRNLLNYYRGFGQGDDRLLAILDSLDHLASIEATSDSGYWNEADAFTEALKKLEEYLTVLDDQEKELRETLWNRQENRWYTDEEVAQSEELTERDRQANLRQDLVDNRRRMVSDLHHYLEVQALGRLRIDLPPQTVENPTLSEEDREKFREIFPAQEKKYEDRGWYMVNRLSPIGPGYKVLEPVRHIDSRGKTMDSRTHLNGISKALESMSDTISQIVPMRDSLADRPLFPHEPCPNDISQEALGDCYYLAALSKIAQVNPEKIKESMRDNQDGTVTVRLYSKSQQGEYRPLFVTVDKISENAAMGRRNSLNSVWVNCMERALAVSGLMARPKAGMLGYEPVPANIEAVYQALLEKEKAGLLEGDNLKRARDAYPWLFTHDTEPHLVSWPNLEGIEGGHSANAMEILLGPGYAAEQVELPEVKEASTTLSPEEQTCFQKILHCTRREIPITAASREDAKEVQAKHAFTLLDAYEADGVKYVRLRNPYGIDNVGLHSVVHEDGRIGLKDVKSDQSVFDIDFSSFCKNFRAVEISGYHRDEVVLETVKPKKREKKEEKEKKEGQEKKEEQEKKEKQEKKEEKESQMELSDRDFLGSYKRLGDYLAMAPLQEAARNNPSSTIAYTDPDGIFLTAKYWRNAILDPDNIFPEYRGKVIPQSLSDDVLAFRKDLQEVLRQSLKDKELYGKEVPMEKVCQDLVKSENRLISEGKNPESKDFLKKMYELILKKANVLKTQSEMEKMPGEEDLNAMYDSMSQKMDRCGDQFMAYFRKAAGGNSYRIRRLYRGDDGVRMVHYSDVSGDRYCTFREAYRLAESFTFKDLRPEAGKGQIAPGEQLPVVREAATVQTSEKLNYDSYMQYSKALTDLDQTLAADSNRFDGSSPEFLRLRETLKDVRVSLAKQSRIDFPTLQEKLNALNEPLQHYEAHCAQRPRGGSRREKRMKVCGMLRDLQQAAAAENTEPLSGYQKTYASRIFRAVALAKGKQCDERQAETAAQNLLGNSRFRGFLVNQNIFHMEHSTDREVKKDLDRMTKQADRFAKKTEEKAASMIENSAEPVLQ